MRRGWGRRAHAVPMHDAGTGRADRATAVVVRCGRLVVGLRRARSPLTTRHSRHGTQPQLRATAPSFPAARRGTSSVAGDKRRRGGGALRRWVRLGGATKRKQEPWPSRSEIESSLSPSPRNARRGRAPCSRSSGATRRRGTGSSGTTATRRATRRPRARCTPRASQPAQEADEGLRVARSPANDAPSAQHGAESRGVGCVEAGPAASTPGLRAAVRRPRATRRGNAPSGARDRLRGQCPNGVHRAAGNARPGTLA